ncbi:MAG: Fur family transcriptional regulator [Candidatus Nanopelagicales bacterium]
MVIGVRSTRPRRLVAEALESFDDFRSAQEIHDALAARGESVGRATVYRTLRAMALTPNVDVMVRPDGETVYRHCTPNHHHHLVCRGCGVTIEIVGPVVEQWSNQTAAEHGFDEVSHTLEVFGRCAACRQRDQLRGAGRRRRSATGDSA